MNIPPPIEVVVFISHNSPKIDHVHFYSRLPQKTNLPPTQIVVEYRNHTLLYLIGTLMISGMLPIPIVSTTALAEHQTTVALHEEWIQQPIRKNPIRPPPKHNHFFHREKWLFYYKNPLCF